MSRRTLVMMAATVVVAAGAIVLAVMTRSEPSPLKLRSQAARERSISTVSASTGAPAQNSSAPAAVLAPSSDHTDDVAGPGNGSAGEILQRLVDEYAQRHWANAIAACLNPDVAIAGAKECAVSACELHDIAHARRFYTRVAAADRNEVRADCERMRIPVDRPLRPQLGTHRRPFRSPIVSPAGSGG
jgi:hypothetical protein